MKKIGQFRDEFFFLSNFYPIEIEIGEKKYKSTEHYYQACKALDPNDHEKIRNTLSPADSKKAARKIGSFNQNWDNIRDDVMMKALRAKFSIPEMKEALLATDDFYLEEGNWWGDTYWGVCGGTGKNMLGKMLMRIREEVKCPPHSWNDERCEKCGTKDWMTG